MTYRFETLQLHGGHHLDETGARAVPIYQTTSFVFDSPEQAANRFALKEAGGIYSRIGNPTNDVLEARLAALEGGIAALTTASGSAAIFYALSNIAQAGDHIVAASTLYGGTYNLLSVTLPRYGIATTFVDTDDLETVRAAIRPETKAIFVESIGNPDANLVDLDALSAIAHEHGILVIVDNTFGTPYLYRPFEHGADVVVHSLTKYVGGHGTTLGGVLIEKGGFDYRASGRYPDFVTPDSHYNGVIYADTPAPFAIKARVQLLRDTGACLTPLAAFLLLQGLETLSLRVERHVENARRVARYLAEHPAVSWVHYPELEDSPYKALADRDFPNGVGAVFTFGVRGGRAAGIRLIESVELFSHLANVADAKSLLIHPASTTHSQLTPEELAAAGIGEDTIRISVGLEHIDDILADLEHALEAAEQA